MSLPETVAKCVPAEGLLPQLIELLYDNNPRIDPHILIGAALPFLQYELNSRGFHVNVGQGPLPFSTFSLMVTNSGLGKSSLWRNLQTIRAAASTLADTRGDHEALVALDGSTAGLMEALEACYDEELNVSPALLFSDEIGTVLANGGKGNGKAADMFGYLNTMLQGDTKEEKLKAGERRVTNPRLSGCGFMTPASLNLLTDLVLRGGLLGRLLLLSSNVDRMAPFYGERAALTADRLDPLITGYRQWLNGLDLKRGKSRLTITTTADADEYLLGVYNKFDKDYKNAPPQVRPYFNRVIEKSLILGGLYASLRGGDAIERQDVVPAVALLEVSVASFLAVLDSEDFTNASGSERSRELNANATAALQMLDAVGEAGLSPGMFIGTGRPAACKGKGIGRVGHFKRDVELLLEPCLEGDAPLVLCVGKTEWSTFKRYYLAKIAESGEANVLQIKATGAPAPRYYGIEHVPEVLTEFLNGDASQGNMMSLRGGRDRLTPWMRHREYWTEQGWGNIPPKKAWEKLREEAEASSHNTFMHKGETHEWPVHLEEGWAKKAFDPRD